MISYIYFNIRRFHDSIALLFRIAIIIELYPILTIKIYTIFRYFYITFNIYILKKGYVITIKHSKKNKKKEL